jgi:methionine salvage enolase-phosphatase E1
MSDKKIIELDNQIDTIICDIEGTTTSISFVKVNLI